MKLEGYTPEVFLENFIKDSEVFGVETAQAIYEEILSVISEKKIKLDGFVKVLEESITEYLGDNTLLETPADTRMIQDYVATMVNQHYLANNSSALKNAISMMSAPDGAAAANGKTAFEAIINGSNEAAAKAVSDIYGKLAASQSSINGAGFLAKIGGFLKTLPAKVKTFFGSLQGKSFSEIMKQGMAWLQANPMIALKTTGGIALVALLIRALKKRKELNKYKALQSIYSKTMNENFEENSLEAIAINKVIEECKTNKALNNLIFGEEKMESEKSYFAY